MDGTLLDTERIAYQGFVATCARFGVNSDFSAYSRCIGASGTHTKEVLGALLGTRVAVDEFHAAWQAHYVAHAVHGPVPVKTGAKELLAMLGAWAIPMAVVTSTRTTHAHIKLENAGLLAHFEFVIGGDQVPHSKPEPLIYQRAADRLGLAPARCLAVEDSVNGILAACRAGCRTVHVADLVALPATFDGHVERRFGSLAELAAELQREMTEL